jgi:hypothetical protein
MKPDNDLGHVGLFLSAGVSVTGYQHLPNRELWNMRATCVTSAACKPPPFVGCLSPPSPRRRYSHSSTIRGPSPCRLPKPSWLKAPSRMLGLA